MTNLKLESLRQLRTLFPPFFTTPWKTFVEAVLLMHFASILGMGRIWVNFRKQPLQSHGERTGDRDLLELADSTENWAIPKNPTVVPPTSFSNNLPLRSPSRTPLKNCIIDCAIHHRYWSAPSQTWFLTSLLFMDLSPRHLPGEHFKWSQLIIRNALFQRMTTDRPPPRTSNRVVQ